MAADEVAELFAPDGKTTLTLPRAAAPGESLTLRVTVGALPRKSRIIIYGDDGKVLGAIAPFGAAQRKQGGVHTIPISLSYAVDGKVSLRLLVEETEGGTGRPPTKAEVLKAELAFLR